MNKILFFLWIIIITNSVLCTPHLSGIVELDMENGFFKCDLKLSDLPQFSNYGIILNRGMNIKCFKDSGGNSIRYDLCLNGKKDDEGSEYYLVNNVENAQETCKSPLKKEFGIEYVGAFPVYSDKPSLIDFKGIIAINGKTLRATEQTKWYPVIYDTDKDKLIDKYIYDITVVTKKIRTIFINGNAPQKGNKVCLTSSKAFPLFLFVGDYNFIEANGDYLINIDVSKEVALNILENLMNLKQYYKNLLDKEFSDNIYIINHKALYNRPSIWGFNVYPSFAFSNLDFNTLLTKEGKFNDMTNHFFGHELAHNYFMNNVMSGKLFWFWLESTAEYLSTYVIKKFSGEKCLKEYILNNIKIIENEKLIPLSKITSSEQINEVYKYKVGPLLYKAFEIKFGQEKTIKMLRRILERSYSETLTINSWEQASIEGGISREEFLKFKLEFLESDNFIQNIINILSK